MFSELMLAAAATLLPPPLDSPSPLPPAEYRKNNSAVIEFTVSPEVYESCKARKGYVTRGCTITAWDLIVMPNPCFYPRDYYATVLCHELGHINGWSHPPAGPEYNKYIKKHGLTPPALDPSPVSRSPSQDIPHE